MPKFRSGIRGIVWPAVPTPKAASILALLYQLEESQWLSPAEIEARQAEQVGALLRHAYDTVPYYRRRWQAAGIDPRTIQAPDDFRRLPLLTREDIQGAGKEIFSQACPPSHGTPTPIVTSGSTGKPVAVLSTPVTQLFWHVLTLRDHLWHERDFSAKLAAIRFTTARDCEPPDGKEAGNWGAATREVLRTGPCAILSIRSSIEQQARWLARQDPEYLLTYPSNVAALARHGRDHAIRLSRLRQVRTFGEVCEPQVRDICRRVWDVPVVDMYSSQELGYIALECPSGHGYHGQSESVLIELLRPDGTACQPGEIGRLVLTSLHNFASPLIRYELGDYAEAAGPCSCGRGLVALKRIAGRKRNMLLLPNGEERWPSIEVEAAAAGLGELPPVRQFQVIQRSLEEVEALLVVARPLSETEKGTLKAWLAHGLGHEFDVRFTYVEAIPPSPTGKFEDFRSDLAANGAPRP